MEIDKWIIEPEPKCLFCSGEDPCSGQKKSNESENSENTTKELISILVPDQE